MVPTSYLKDVDLLNKEYTINKKTNTAFSFQCVNYTLESASLQILDPTQVSPKMMPVLVFQVSPTTMPVLVFQVSPTTMSVFMSA